MLTLAATTLGIILNPCAITGAPAWLKPAKFAVSISIYCLTLLWLLTFVRGHPRLAVLYAVIVLPRVGPLRNSFERAAGLAALLGTPEGGAIA